MSYKLKSNCERVILHVLANADSSLVGLKFRNAEIISMRYDELEEIIVLSGHSYLLFFMSNSLGNNFVSENELIVLEIMDYDSNSCFLADEICDYLHLYKAEDIYSCFFHSYRFREGKILGGGIGRTNVRTHGVGLFIHPYQLTEEERKAFPNWVEKNILPRKYEDTFMSIRKMYLTSYYLGNIDMEYIMLFSILESLFGANYEITYQISRGVAILLSKNPDEFSEIFKKMKKLYTARSKYVHASQHITKENLAQLREVVRNLLFRLLDLGITSDKELKTLPEKVTLAGYPVFSAEGAKNE